MNKDEIVQRQIEDGEAPEGMDGDAYRIIFRVLKKEPEINLSDDFAQRVASRAFASKTSFDWDRFFLFGGLGVFAFVLIYATAITGFRFSFGEFKFLSNYRALFVFGTAFIWGLHFLDKRIFHSMSSNK